MNPVVFNSLPEQSSLSEYLHVFIMPLVAVLFLGAGIYMKGIPDPIAPAPQKVIRTKARIHFNEPVTPPPPPKVVVRKKKPLPVKPVDLTQKPVIKKDIPEEQPVVTDSPKKVRKVYGLRKVYSKGLGSGGSLSNAVVAKLGNTINKEIDTITATSSDIKGRITSTATVSVAPRIKKRITPVYTKTMKEHQVAGKVKARVLVDVDGKAKKIIIIHDLGFGTREASIEAINKMMFEPARIDDSPVAVWIPLTFRFEFYV